MARRPTGPSGLRGRVTQPRNIPRWWTMTAAQSREYHFIGPKDFRPPSQRTPGPANYNKGSAPPPPYQTTYSSGSGGWKPAQILGPGYTPAKPGGSVPSVKRTPSRQITRPPTGTTYADAMRSAARLARFARTLARFNPYLNALDIGFQLLDSWAAYGPQAEPTPEVPAHWDVSGTPWTHYSNCEANAPHDTFASAALGTADCIGGQAIGASNRYSDYESMINARPNMTTWATWRGTQISPGLFRFSQVDRFTRTGTGVVPGPLWVPYQPPQPGRKTVQRSPATVTPPAPAVRDYTTPPRDTAGEAPIIGPAKPLSPRLPSERPANTIEVSPGGIHRPPQNPHVQAPPTGGREIKIQAQKGSPLYNALSKLYNGATEADDFIDVVADSIEGNPCKGLKPVEMAYCVGQNWDKISVPKLIYGLVYNHYEDKAVGTFLSYGKKSPYGVQTPTTAPSRSPRYKRNQPRVHR